VPYLYIGHILLRFFAKRSVTKKKRIELGRGSSAKVILRCVFFAKCAIKTKRIRELPLCGLRFLISKQGVISSKSIT
jgi:hypothetical protein